MAGRKLITPGKSISRCLTSKKEKRKENSMIDKSQQNIIQRGAYLFLKKFSSIEGLLASYI